MASEYLLKKYKDVKPDEERELTPKEKRQNWWYYHKWHVVIGFILLLICLDLGKSALHIGEVKPDLQIAYVGTYRLPDDTAEAIEKAFETIAEDANNDGKITVQLNQYASADDGGDGSVVSSSGGYYMAASVVTLMGDLEDCDSFLFLLEDCESFQTNYEILEEDGSGTVLAEKWSSLSALSGLDLGEYEDTVAGTDVTGSSSALVQDLWVARRVFDGDRTCDYPEACEALWEQIFKR